MPVLESRKTANLVERFDMALHDLCQPLTVLQCRLSMGEIIGEPEAMREAIREGLSECVRLNAVVGIMHEIVQQSFEKEESERER